MEKFRSKKYDFLEIKITTLYNTLSYLIYDCRDVFTNDLIYFRNMLGDIEFLVRELRDDEEKQTNKKYKEIEKNENQI